MNERIKLLVEKSYIYDRQNDSSFFDKGLFAELIVRECAEVCYLYNAAGGADTAFVYGYKDCGDDIKRNFGIES